MSFNTAVSNIIDRISILKWNSDDLVNPLRKELNQKLYEYIRIYRPTQKEQLTAIKIIIDFLHNNSADIQISKDINYSKHSRFFTLSEVRRLLKTYNAPLRIKNTSKLAIVNLVFLAVQFVYVLSNVSFDIKNTRDISYSSINHYMTEDQLCIELGLKESIYYL